MKFVNADIVEYLANGGKRYRAILLSSTTPASLTITGADVDGMQDNDVLAVGSVLITPTTNYIAFADGVFTAKGAGA